MSETGKTSGTETDSKTAKDKETKKKQPGFLRRRFNAVVDGIWSSVPKTPGQAIWKTLSATRAYLVIPFSLKGVFAAVAFSVFVTPMGAALFPTAQDFLKNEGLDPQIADKLAPGETIRVRERGFFGTGAALFDLPLFMGLPQINLTHPAAAYAIHNPVYNQCRVLLPSKDVTAKEAISAFTGMPQDQIENVPITGKEIYYTIAFHEFRHCAEGNADEPFINLREGNADIEAIKIAAETFKNPEILKAFMYMRALSFEATHDGTLYIDSEINGSDIIFKELSRTANEEAFIYMEKYYEGEVPKIEIPLLGEMRGGVNVFAAYKAFQTVLEKHGDQMSPLAKKRAELFMEALEYFAPTEVQELKQVPEARKANAPRPNS